jgi:hypothetical protein
MTIDKSDIADLDIVDAAELASDGYSVYRTDALVSTTASTGYVVINSTTSLDILENKDEPVEAGDRVYISGNAADGYYTVDAIISSDTFSVVEPIVDSIGGSVAFMYPAGATKVGVNHLLLTQSTATTLQGVLQDLDAAVTAGGITATQHAALRQLVHLADGVGGPFEEFLSGAYREILPAASPFPTSITWWESAAKLKKIVEKTTTLNANKTPSTIEWKAYDTDGSTVLATVTDTITYSSVFELSRTRTIS